MSSKRRAATRTATAPEPDLDPLDTAGWVAVPDVLSRQEAQRLAEDCRSALATIEADVRVGDKQVGGTHRLVDLLDRVPAVQNVVDHPALAAGVAWFLGDDARVGGVTFRSAEPGFGEQRFHADDLPLMTPGAWRVVTAIVALCDFTPHNGATAVLPGSHRRPDLQRRSGSLEGHPQELVLTGPAGTAFLFSGHLLHRGTRNRTTAARPALQVSWGAGPPAAPTVTSGEEESGGVAGEVGPGEDPDRT